MLQSKFSLISCFILGIIVLIVGIICNVLFGYHTYSINTLYDALFHYDDSKAHITIMTLSIPRALIAASVGASLAVAGAIMQALTRNALASPSIFGINAGAVLFITLAISFIDSGLTLQALVWFGFAGAAITAILVYSIGLFGRGEIHVNIVLAGAAISAFCSSLTSIIYLVRKENMDTVLFWLIGSLSGREMSHLMAVLPYIVIAMIGAFCTSRSLNVLSMGEDVSRGLGQRTKLIKMVLAIIVVVLAGASVSITGPIGLVGLIIPHVSRFLVGIDYRKIILYSMVLGANLLVYGDLLAKQLLPAEDMPIGVATAVLGVPFFIYLARKRG
ncbi:iron ABC transporter permease [Paenibacillus sp. GSMTC-2017]|uniref:FecCD family ABC transporter permease n=1 Tax=Paenibacillus sp. GSMTC-2017 TaxID=2794350 RepID=UPI0018D64374|nr:iron ABC transporter permease [Paenibacillus sp. GSMTC-2017]MBH5320141.1 iron ABC transporter permease [Paenibacillus sp. GSMTC-2017]